MSTPVYTTVPGKLPKLFETIGNAGVPAKANVTWLKKLGFTSSNDGSMLPVLRYIGFLDDSGSPTQTWLDYRGADSRKVIANAIMASYDDLFHTMPSADTASVNALTSYFKANTTAGEQAVSKIVSTFRNLVGLADFSESTNSSLNMTDSSEIPSTQPSGGDSTQMHSVSVAGSASLPLSINVNIQLTLPATDEQAVFDAIFRSLKANILDR